MKKPGGRREASHRGKRPRGLARRGSKRDNARSSTGSASAKRPSSPAEHSAFPIVGIGASAGGLEAFTQLLKALPPDTGMAFALMQHHDPRQKSTLRQILAHSTAMPVMDVAAGMAVRPDTVYVVPGNAELADGRFRLLPPSTPRQRKMPIDDFFQSLAEAYKSRAIGVVLSGSLTDGALGLRAIKSEGGVTFAQDQKSARFPDMPRAAVAANAVDFVLPPEKIARELNRMGGHPYIRPVAPAAEQPLEGGDYQRILAALRNAMGVDFSDYRQTTIRRRISRRMALKRVDTLKDYVELLRSDPAEAGALYEDILITVTRFFRDPEVFTILRGTVFPSLLKDRSADSPVRVWVPGCSTGEEVYSIAMVLFEALRELEVSPPVQIFATDISESAIEKARAGLYLENAMVDVSPERRRRFFSRVDGGYQISKTIRDVCVFARQNIASDPPFSSLDLISCRNMLIYLEHVLQKRVIPLFHYALKPSGFLMLGSAETIGGFSDLFQPVDRLHRIFAKRAGSSRRAPDFRLDRKRDPSPARTETAKTEVPPRAPVVDLQKEADRFVVGRYGPPGVLISDQFEVIHFRGKTSPYLEAAPGAASFNVLKMAREGLLVELRASVLKAKKTGRPVRAEGVRVRQDGAVRAVDLEVVPIRDDSSAQSFLILFEEPERRRPVRKLPPAPKQQRSGKRADHETIAKLEQELTATKEYLQSIIEEQEASNEELKSTNEEILSSNEELQSTNEELETAKEELQSTNEELTTVNEELQTRNVELAQANNDLLNLLASMQIPVLILSMDGRLRHFTPQAETLFNLIPSDVGRRLRDMKPNVEVPDLPDVVAEVIKTAQTHERELQDASGRWYLMRVRPYRTAKNRIEGALVAFLDVDPLLKRTLEQIDRARNYAEGLVETVRESLIVLDEKLRIRTANRIFYRTFRTSHKETERKKFFELFEVRSPTPDLAEGLQRALEGKEPLVDHEIEVEAESLGRRTLCVNAHRVRFPGEEQSLLMLAVEDITERREADRKLKESESRYRRLFESAREGIWLLDAESGEILDVNSYLLERLGCQREELVGHKPWLTGVFEEAEEARRNFRRVRENGFAFEPEVRLRSKAGGRMHFESISNVVETDSSRIIQENLRDITERARLEDQLRQIQKLESIGTLAGGVAHDFNNLLNIISAHLSLLGRQEGNASGSAEHRAAIEHAVKRASAVVKQLLTFARKTEVSFEDVDLNAVIREVAAMLQETLLRSIAITVELEDELPSVRGDANQLHQALLNLALNARDAMENGGQLTLRSEIVRGEFVKQKEPEASAQRYVSATVSDTGTGMDSETRQRIFEPFFTTKKEKGGEGLGLPVVYGIVNSHRGWVDVESEVGRGTTFRLFFPVAGEDRAATAKSKKSSRKRSVAPAVSPATGGNGRILLIEDEEMLRRPIQSLLEGEGYEVLTAGDGIEAVDLYRSRKHEISAVLLDLGLPKLDGWHAFLQMKRANPDVRCIVASGNIDRQQRIQMREAGVLATLRKPYGAEEVLSTLRDVLAMD